MADADLHPGLVRLSAGGHSVTIDPAVGNLRSLGFSVDGRSLSPLHRAPWADDPDVGADAHLAPVERTLSGDFFCAPFGASDVEPAPPHGWSANSPWTVVEAGDGAAHLSLGRPVLGAAIEKRLRLSADAPILYQSHVIRGGQGGLPVAHHPMIRLAGRGWLSVSPKRVAVTPTRPLDPGRHRLACPAETTDLTRLPTTDGGPLNLRALPIADRHEDFLTLIEVPDRRLGWTAVIREDEDDLIFVLKDPTVLPITMLWHSNGGRDHAPWLGRHRGVLGIEDGCAAGADGHAAALGPNPIARHGVATALPLAPGHTHRIAHAIGAIPRPKGWQTVTDIAVDGDRLVLIEAEGGRLVLPFDPFFFTERS